MKNNLLSLTQKLISIKSNQDNPKALAEILELVKTKLSEFTIETFEKNGSKSILVYNSKTRPKTFKILLNGHLDVIPGKEFQYKPKIEADRLYGVGSMDMKAGVACLITVFKKLATKVDYPLGLQLVTDEQIGGFNGTAYQIESGVSANFVISAEPTNLNIVHKAKGIYALDISAKGLTAHGAYPWRGDNAIWKLVDLLHQIKLAFPSPISEVWQTTVNLAKIDTNNLALNKIPDNCSAQLDFRYTPEDADSIKPKIHQLISSEFEVKVLIDEPTLFVEKSNPYITKLKSVTDQVTGNQVKLYGAQGTSDARHFTKVGIPGVEFGPVGGNIAADNEWVSIKSLATYCQVLERFLKEV